MSMVTWLNSFLVTLTHYFLVLLCWDGLFGAVVLPTFIWYGPLCIHSHCLDVNHSLCSAYTKGFVLWHLMFLTYFCCCLVVMNCSLTLFGVMHQFFMLKQGTYLILLPILDFEKMKKGANIRNGNDERIPDLCIRFTLSWNNSPSMRPFRVTF